MANNNPIGVFDSGVGGISFVFFILHKTVPIEQIAPKKNDAYTHVGKEPVVPIKIKGKINKDKFANTYWDLGRYYFKLFKDKEAKAILELRLQRLTGMERNKLEKETEEKDDYRHFSELINNGIPLVMFDRVVDHLDCNKVVADDIGGAFLATEQLLKNGCSRIALITTPDYVIVGHERKEGYLKALQENNIDLNEDLIIEVDDKNSFAF